jgi:hypothetical protein
LTSSGHRVAGSRLIVLHLYGRRTGRPYDVLVRRHQIGGFPYVLTHSQWRVNLLGGVPVEVTRHGVRLPALATPVSSPSETAELYREVIAREGPRAMRRLGLHRPGGGTPDHAELRDAVGRLGLTAIRLEPRHVGRSG